MPIFRFYQDVEAPDEVKAKHALVSYHEHCVLEDGNTIENALDVEKLLPETAPDPANGDVIHWTEDDEVAYKELRNNDD